MEKITCTLLCFTFLFVITSGAQAGLFASKEEKFIEACQKNWLTKEAEEAKSICQCQLYNLQNNPEIKDSSDKYGNGKDLRDVALDTVIKGKQMELANRMLPSSPEAPFYGALARADMACTNEHHRAKVLTPPAP